MWRALAVLLLGGLSLAMAAIVVTEAFNDTGLPGWAMALLVLGVVLLGGIIQVLVGNA